MSDIIISVDVPEVISISEITETNYEITVQQVAPIEITVQDGVLWGDIQGTLSDQTDLQAALDLKSDTSHNHNLNDLTEKSYNSLDDLPTIPDELADLIDDADHRTVTDVEKSTWNNKSEKSQTGEFFIDDYEIIPATTYTYEISLNRTDYNLGRILLYAPNSIFLTANKRMHAFIIFTNVLNNAIAQSGGREVYNVYGYNFTDYWVKGYKYEDDSKLSDVYFFDNGSQSGLRGQLRIESCQIVSDKIELKFRNTHGSRNTNITIKGRWVVEKT